jgi:uncharacterized protein YukE
MARLVFMTLCAAMIATTSARHLEHLHECQAVYAEAIGSTTRDQTKERCDAIHQLYLCSNEVHGFSDAEAAVAQAFLDATQYVADCSAYTYVEDKVPLLAKSYSDAQIDRDHDIHFFKRRDVGATVSIRDLADSADTFDATLDDLDCVNDRLIAAAKRELMEAFETKLAAAAAETESALNDISSSLTNLVTTVAANAATRGDSVSKNIISEKAKLQSSVEAAIVEQKDSINSVHATVNAGIKSLETEFDGQIDDIEGLTKSAQSIVELELNSVRNDITAGTLEITSQVNAVELNLQTTSVTLSNLIAAQVAENRGYVYEHWGKSRCKLDHKTIYGGFAYGAHHGHSGSGGTICVPHNPSGGRDTGTSSLDLMYGLSIDHNHGTTFSRICAITCVKC